MPVSRLHLLNNLKSYSPKGSNLGPDLSWKGLIGRKIGLEFGPVDPGRPVLAGIGGRVCVSSVCQGKRRLSSAQSTISSPFPLLAPRSGEDSDFGIPSALRAESPRYNRPLSPLFSRDRACLCIDGISGPKIPCRQVVAFGPPIETMCKECCLPWPLMPFIGPSSRGPVQGVTFRS